MQGIGILIFSRENDNQILSTVFIFKILFTSSSCTIAGYFVARNIKDATVSHFYHKRITSGCNDFKAFAKCSLNHETEYNPFIPHILEAWSQRDHPNLFFTTYEDMKTDLRNVASGVLRFLKGEGRLGIKQQKIIRSNVINSIL